MTFEEELQDFHSKFQTVLSQCNATGEPVINEQEYLSIVFTIWQTIADETSHRLDEKKSCLFANLLLDAINIAGAIFQTYPAPRDELLESLVHAELLGLLLNELPTLHLQFFSGKYRQVQSQLRFNWERIFYACRADDEVKGSTLEDKHAWLTNRKQPLGWNEGIQPILADLSFTDTEIESHFKPLWKRLHCYVHPSGLLREKLLWGGDCLHFRDTFHEATALETLDAAEEVFGLIWLATFKRFTIAEEVLMVSPRLRAFMKTQWQRWKPG
jgi:hypothetical protein